MDKVYFHHYKASSHTANLTTEYLVKMKAELGISCINKDEIPVKAPDGSPLDFFGFGYLKQRLCPEGPELWMVFGNFLRRYGRKSISLKSKESSIVEKTITANISKGRRTYRTNKGNPSKTL